MSTLPSGYVYKPHPKSVLEAFSQNSSERLKSIGKSALHSYINSFLSQQGVNRSITETVTPSGLSFITDKSFQEDLDPIKRQTQLARFYHEIRAKVPAILIIDAGLNWRPTSLGAIEKATLINGHWQGWFTPIAGVPLTISTVTADQETTDVLQNILALMFGPLRNLAGGSRIFSTNQSDTWEVRLPLTFSAGANSQTAVSDDPKNQLWASTLDLEIEV